jgi:hypothetical protein
MCSCLVKLVNASACGLNYLYGDCSRAAKMPSIPTQRALAVLFSIASRWLALGKLLATHDGTFNIDNAYTGAET